MPSETPMPDGEHTISLTLSLRVKVATMGGTPFTDILAVNGDSQGGAGRRMYENEIGYVVERLAGQAVAERREFGRVVDSRDIAKADPFEHI